jgi:hypothetical protein
MPPYSFSIEHIEDIAFDTLHPIQKEQFAYQLRIIISLRETGIMSKLNVAKT